MARGLTLSSHTTPNPILLFNSFRRIHSTQWIFSITTRRPLYRPKVTLFPRIYCNCAATQNLTDLSPYNETFSKRMAMAGLKPHHRIAIGVSGGPDSMSLCVLAANWKAASVADNSCDIDGLLAIIVDHGLRAESRDEAVLVSRRVSEMGIPFELARCEWPDGKPKQGHLQEAARDMRYQKFQEVCVRNCISVLMVAHHADDQAELFILRLSRNSGVLGLAGMAFSSQLFSSSLSHFCDSHANGILLVRPLLDLSKEDMYKICEGGGTEWVEDPTNQSQLYARNRIQRSLGQSSSVFDRELQAVVQACRDTRLYVDGICQNLMNKALTVVPYGYVVIDLELLSPSDVAEICLSKFLASVLQFVSQRHRPVRGSTSKLLLDYIRTFPCKTSLTAAGCYLCAAPGSKGTKMLVCCSVNYPLPSKVELICERSDDNNERNRPDELEKIIADGNLSSSHSTPNAEEVRFLDVPADNILLEAKWLNILSEATYNSILLLRREETENFKRKPGGYSDYEHKQEGDLEPTCNATQIHSGSTYDFMKRFVVKFEWSSQITGNLMHTKEKSLEEGLEIDKKNRKGATCVLGPDVTVYVRHMVDKDWLYLAKLSKFSSEEELQSHVLSSSHDSIGSMEKVKACLDYAKLSAQRSLLKLKKIPVSARRGLPVLIDSQEKLLAIPSIGFKQFPCFTVEAEFKPRVPLGGGHSSFR